GSDNEGEGSGPLRGLEVFFNPHGNCTACAYETAVVLMLDTEAQPIGDGAINFRQHRNNPKKFADSEGRPQEGWRWLNHHVPPARVSIAESDDHAWTFARDTLGRLFLIDSNQQIFKRLTRAQDAQRGVYTMDLVDVLPPFNYLDPVGDEDGSLTLYY